MEIFDCQSEPTQSVRTSRGNKFVALSKQKRTAFVVLISDMFLKKVVSVIEIHRAKFIAQLTVYTCICGLL